MAVIAPLALQLPPASWSRRSLLQLALQLLLQWSLQSFVKLLLRMLLQLSLWGSQRLLLQLSMQPLLQLCGESRGFSKVKILWCSGVPRAGPARLCGMPHVVGWRSKVLKASLDAVVGNLRYVFWSHGTKWR